MSFSLRFIKPWELTNLNKIFNVQLDLPVWSQPLIDRTQKGKSRLLHGNLRFHESQCMQGRKGVCIAYLCVYPQLDIHTDKTFLHSHVDTALPLDLYPIQGEESNPVSTLSSQEPVQTCLQVVQSIKKIFIVDKTHIPTTIIK